MKAEKRPVIEVELLHPNAKLPKYAHDGDAGADVYSCEDVVIQPNESVMIDLGFRMKIPNGWEVQVRPRSGLALKQKLTVLNSPGTIDSGYLGICKVILFNHGKYPAKILRGTRVAQFVLKEAPIANFVQVDKLRHETARGEGGFGSSGLR